MRRRFRSPALVLLATSIAALGVVAAPAAAQSPAPLTPPQLPSPGSPPAPEVEVPMSTTPPQPGAAQPVLPGSAPDAPEKPTSPVIEQIVRDKEPLVVRKAPARRAVLLPPHRRYVTRRRSTPDRVLERPALAGVVLVAPLPPPPEGPHVTVPVPAYPVESVVARFTTPPPPIRCHPTWRDPYAPNPHLAREVPVECEPDED